MSSSLIASQAIWRTDIRAGIAGRTLVVIEMGGGNDGLSTVVPYADGRYHENVGHLGEARRLSARAIELAERLPVRERYLVEGKHYANSWATFGGFCPALVFSLRPTLSGDKRNRLLFPFIIFQISIAD